MLEIFDQITSKDIILVLAGSLITFLGFISKLAFTYLKNFKHITPFVGIWYVFHYSRSAGQIICRKEEWRIERTFRGIKISTDDDERPNLKYRGKISFDLHHSIVSLYSENSPEIIQCRFRQPIENNRIVMPGIQVGKDFDHRMYSTVRLAFKNTDPGEIEAKKEIAAYTIWNDKDFSLRLNK